MGCVRRNLPHSGWLLSQGPASVLGLSPLLSGPRSGSDSFPRERPLRVLLTRGRRPTRPARRAPRRTPRGRFGEKHVPCTCRSRRPTFIFQTRLITVHTFVHMSIAIFGPPRPPPPADSALARGCPVRSPLHHCPRVMLSQIPRSNEPESPAGSIHHGFMSAKEAAAGESVIRWGLGVQRSGPWSQDPRGVGSNPSPSTAGRVTLGTTCIHPLCTSPVTLTLGSYMDEMNNDS